MKDNKKKEIKYIQSSEAEKRPWSLLALGVLCVILGILSATGLIARTIFYVSPDYIVVVGVIAILIALVWRKKKL